jgi:starch phosphorylase
MCKGKVQLVFAGKAHPKDIPGKEVIRKIYQVSKQYEKSQEIKMVFLPNYCMELGLLLTAGVDVWLNTPIRPREASGTSGMKAVHNGVPNFSVLDGWWVEGCVDGVTGWAIGPEAKEANLIENNNSEDAESLYQKLENQVIPTYYHNRPVWIQIMKQAIAQNASYFNTQRMLKEYLERAYQLDGVVFAQALSA